MSEIRAATYRRVSTYRQREGTSPETQLERGHQLIDSQGWVHEHAWDFYDGGVSGAKASRTDLDRLFELCRHGQLDVVVVGDLQRLSRDMRHSLNFEYELAQLGVKVIDADNPNADELARMFSYLQGHWQRAQIRKITHRGIVAVAEAGYWPSGPPPVGWKLAPAPDNPKRKVVVLQETEATTIRKAVELVVDDRLSCYEAARRLNAGEYLPRKGGRWTNIALRRMLRRDHLAGEWTFHKDGREITIRGPEIISADRLAQLRKTMDSTATVRAGNRVYPLTGRVTGRCGQVYTGTSRPDRRLRQYECHTNHPRFEGTGRRCWCPRINANWLEQTVWAEVVKVLSDPERLLALAQQHLNLRRGELHAEGQQISDLDRRLAAAKRKRTNLALAAADTGPAAIAEALAEINRDVDILEQMLAQARAWAQANAERAALVRDLWRLAEVAQTKLADPTPEVQREVLIALDVRVQLADEGVRHGQQLHPRLRISGVLMSDLTELTGELGNLADGVPGRR
jgi:site-specific DNA recombinase